MFCLEKYCPQAAGGNQCANHSGLVAIAHTLTDSPQTVCDYNKTFRVWHLSDSEMERTIRIDASVEIWQIRRYEIYAKIVRNRGVITPLRKLTQTLELCGCNIF